MVGYNWQRPGKTSRDISATLGKCGPGILYNFSSNAYPFEQNACYTPFAIVALLEYWGDYSAFASVLAKEYGGES